MWEIVPAKQAKVQITVVLIKGLLRATFCIACSQDVRKFQ